MSQNNTEVEESPPPENGWNVRKIMSWITIEPFIICWFLPFFLTGAAIENLNLEKICREIVDQRLENQTSIDKDICKLSVLKSNFELKCDGNLTMNWDAVSETFPDTFALTMGIQDEVAQFLCDSEVKVQEKLSNINAFRNSLSAIGPFIVLWFAGPWSDRKNLRLPCMLVPYLGEMIGYSILFISAIFFDSPVELPAYGYRFIPAFTGSEILMTMAVFSYLAAISTEENRTFRFGLFQVMMAIIPIAGSLISPTLNRHFGYVQLFGMMIPIHILGLLYFFRLKEPSKVQKSEQNGHDNLGVDHETSSSASANQNRTEILNQSNLDIIESETEKPKNFCLDFFDLRHAKLCITVLMKSRENVIRPLLILLLSVHFLSYGIIHGESPLVILVQRLTLNWDVDYTSYNIAWSLITSTCGTIVMIGLFSKILQIPDVYLAFVSIIFSIISRLIYFSIRTTIGFFFGTFVDATGTVKILVTRSIVSKIVPSDEMATIFSLMGVLEALPQLVFSYIYPAVYNELLPSSNVSFIFMLTIAILLTIFAIYCVIFKLLRRKESAESPTENIKTTKL